MRNHWLLVFLFLTQLTGFMCTRDRSVDSNHLEILLIRILFNGPNYEGDSYEGILPATEYALWIEDQDGKCLTTLEITQTAVTVDSVHGSHVEHLAVWAEAAGVTYDLLAQTTDSGIPATFDGITAASRTIYQNPDTPVLLEKEWDLTDNHGLNIQSGIIYVFFEAANIVKYASDEVVTITSEHTAAQVNLNSQQTAPASTTQHILELTVTFQ